MGQPGLRQSEREAYKFILAFLEQGETPSESDKLAFLRAVDTLSSAIHAQAGGTMDDFLPKAVLAEKIETLIQAEPSEFLTSTVRQQAMLCVVTLSQVDPPFHLAQKLDLVNAGVSCVFSLPLIMPSVDRRDSASLYFQTVQALDDMLQALVMDGRDPDMSMLQKMLEILLLWLTTSRKEQEQTRAVHTIAWLLRFICNFPELLHMEEFSISGRLVGTLGIFCMNHSYEVSFGASEGLHYLFKVLVLHRSTNQEMEMVLRELQKNFRGKWLAYLQDLNLFFREYLTPEERADMILVLLEAMAHASENDVSTASRILQMALKSSTLEIGKVPEIVQHIYHNGNRIPEGLAQAATRQVLQLLARAHTDGVILTLFRLQDQPQRGLHKPWEILASSPQSYEAIMEYLLQTLMLPLRTGAPGPGSRTQISPWLATRAIHELLLEPSRRLEVQALFTPLFLTLLLQTSYLVVEGGEDTFRDQQHVTKWMDPVSSSIEALKTLLRSAGYGDHVSYVQRLGGWELLSSVEKHHEGVTLLARAMVVKNCWHGRPVFSLIMQMLQEQDYRDHLTAFVFMTELLRCPEVAAAVNKTTIRVLISWFQREEPATVKLLLRMVETFAWHGNMARQVRLLQPFVLSCCYSPNSDIVWETFLVLRALVDHLSWVQSSSFLVQLTFTLEPFFEQETEQVRLMAFEIYGALLAKIKKSAFVFPLKHQVLNLLILLALHLVDKSATVTQICRLALCHTAAILRWKRLKTVFAERDMWTILRALLEQETDKAPWFLKQCMALFKSSQAPVRQAAVWFTGQIIQTLYANEGSETEEAHAALRFMRDDPDPMVSCLATQTLYVLEAKQLLVKTPTSCFGGF